MNKTKENIKVVKKEDFNHTEYNIAAEYVYSSKTLQMYSFGTETDLFHRNDGSGYEDCPGKSN